MKLKKLTSLLMAGAMVFALAACGGSTGGDAPASQAPASQEPASQAPESTAPASQEPASQEPAPVSVPVVEEGKLHMSTNAAFPPYEMIADDGSFQGIDVEVAAAIAAKLGLELVVDDMGFDAALMAPQTGKSDIVMAGVTVTEERLEVMEFSDSYATGIQSIIVKEGSPIKTVDDLGSADKIGTQKATTGNIYCEDDYGADHVIAYDSGAIAVQALVNGQVDAVVIDNEPAKSFVAANAGLVILETEYAVEDYAIGMQKGNTILLDAINKAMAELKADGTFQQIVDKYIIAG